MFPDDSLTLHTDLYQINMMQVYFNEGIHNKRAVFEVYFRKNPFNNGYAVFAGLERIVAYLNDLTFSQTDLDYLASLGYNGAFLEYLRDFKMQLTVRSAKEGDLVFANEPIVQVEGPLAQCQSSSLIFPFWERMPMHLCRFMAMITRLSRLMQALIGTVYSW